MSSFTDRYVEAVTTQLPPGQRVDIARELRATIEDTVEARADGVSPEQAERAALLELGHPAALADGYRGSGRALIGPRVYPAWLAMLKLLLSIVPAVVGVVLFLVLLAEGSDSASAVLEALWTAAVAALQVAFWVTVAFAVVEHTDTDVSALAPLTGEGQAWTPDDLPDPAARRVGWGEAVSMIVSSAVGLVLIAVLNPTTQIDGRTVHFLTDAAQTWRWVVVAGFVVSLVVAAFVMMRGSWTPATATANLLGNVLIGAPVILLLVTGTLLEADAVRSVLPQDARDWSWLNVPVLAGIIALALLWDTIAAFRGAVATRRRL